MDVTALIGIQSGSAPLVVSPETVDVRKLDDLSAGGRLHGTMVWRIHLKGLMNAPSMGGMTTATLRNSATRV